MPRSQCRPHSAGEIAAAQAMKRSAEARLSAEQITVAIDMAEKAFILRKLREHDWNVSETARSVEMPRSNLYKKIERYGLVREE